MGNQGCDNTHGFRPTRYLAICKPSKFAGIRALSAARARESKEPLSATRDALAQAIRCFEAGVRPESGVESGIAVLCVLEALKKSAAAGGKRFGYNTDMKKAGDRFEVGAPRRHAGPQEAVSARLYGRSAGNSGGHERPPEGAALRFLGVAGEYFWGNTCSRLSMHSRRNSR